METWTRRLLGDRAGLVANQCESSSSAIAEHLATFTAPLREQAAPGILWVDAALFVGDYGVTPFGIHVDPVSESSLHYNFGPGTKRFLFWDYELVRAARKTRAHLDLDDFCPPTSEFAVAAGEYFYLPAGYGHVAETDGFSTCLAIGMTEHATAQAQLCAALESVTNEFAPTYRSIDDMDGLAARFEIALELEADRWYSNAGLRYRTRAASGGAMDTLDHDDIVVVDPTFPLVGRLAGGRFWLHFRGERLSIAPVPELAALVDMLNTGPAPMRRFVEQPWTEVSDSAVAGLIGRLAREGALSLRPPR